MRGVAGVALGVFLTAAAPAAWAAQDSPRELYGALNDLRVDSHLVYPVRDLHLRRDVVSLSFTEGKLAFFQPLNGRVTGAVFTGAGHVIAIPPDPVERASLARFLGVPLLDQPFSRAYFRFTDGTAEELFRKLDEAGAHGSDEPSFAAEWNQTLAALAPVQSLRVMQDWLSADPKPYFYAGLINGALGAFDVLVDPRREEQVLLGQTVWVQGTRYYNVWASFASAGPERPGADFLPPGYSIDTTILADRTLEGRTTLRLKATRGGERMLPLELSHLLSVESAAEAGGQSLAFFQSEAPSRHRVVRRGNDFLFVVLPAPPAAGQEFELQLRYRGSVISDAGNGVYFVGEHGSWYPHVSGTDQFASFDLTFRWPRRLELVATGRKLAEREEGEWRIGHWRSETPMAVAGFNLGEYAAAAVDAGGLKIELYANRQLEQAILDRFSHMPDPTVMMHPLPAWPSDRRTALSAPAPLPPSPAAVMKQLGRRVGDAVQFYERRLGPFPFERLAVSQIPGSFGQGWPGLLYLSTLTFLPPEAVERFSASPGAERQPLELLPFHEVAHQWWGNVVSWSSYRDQWIEEALANYLALVYADSKAPSGHVLSGWLEQYRKELITKMPETNVTPDQAGPLILGYRLDSSTAPGAYGPVVYGKGTWVIHMLRMMLRDPRAKDPDARFWALLRSLLQNYRYRALTTDNLERELDKVMTPAMDLDSSHSMAWFFDDWVRRTGIPRYKVEFHVRPHGKGILVVGKLQQDGVPETFLAAVPLYAAGAGKPVWLGTVAASGPEASFKFITRARPKRLLIDPQLTLLCQTN